MFKRSQKDEKRKHGFIDEEHINKQVKLDVDGDSFDLNHLPTYLPNTRGAKVIQQQQQHQISGPAPRAGQFVAEIKETQTDSPPLLSSSTNENSSAQDTYIITNHSSPQKKLNPTTKASVPVFGTSIVLETEEDIRKWIEERKKNYPTNKRVLEKQQTQPPQLSKQEQQQQKGKQNTKTQLCRFIKNNKSCRSGDKCKFSHDKTAAAAVANNAKSKQNNKPPVKSLIPEGASIANGTIKEIFGIRTYVPRRFNNTFQANAGKEKQAFMSRLSNRDQLQINTAIVEFAEDLMRNGLIGGESVIRQVKDEL